MKLRITIDRAIDVRERYVDLVGMLLGFTEEGTPATAAKGPSAVAGGGVAMELVTAGMNFELRPRDGEPGDEASPMVPATHRAMTMAAEEAGQAHSKAHRSA
jgi:hypothetical protein